MSTGQKLFSLQRALPATEPDFLISTKAQPQHGTCTSFIVLMSLSPAFHRFARRLLMAHDTFTAFTYTSLNLSERPCVFAKMLLSLPPAKKWSCAAGLSFRVVFKSLHDTGGGFQLAFTSLPFLNQITTGFVLMHSMVVENRGILKK